MAAFQQLRQCRIGKINRTDLSEGQWTYFYDRDICFTRLSFPQMSRPTPVLRGVAAFGTK